MIPFPHSFTIANPPPQIQNNAEAHDHTVRRTAAQQRLPINRHTLTRCPKPTTLNLRTCKFHVFPHAATNNLLSRIPMPTKAYHQTEASHAWNPRTAGYKSGIKGEKPRSPNPAMRPNYLLVLTPCMKEQPSIQPASPHCTLIW